MPPEGHGATTPEAGATRAGQFKIILMKSSLRLLLLSATLAFATHGFAAERWSSDELAVRMGVHAWFSLWTRPAATASDPKVRSLYATQPIASLPAAVQTATQAGALPSAMQKNDRVTVAIEGDRAVSTVDLVSQKAVLIWERRAGLWRIAQETITPASDAAGKVALSEPTRK